MCVCANYEDIRGRGVVAPRILSFDNERRRVASFSVGCLTTGNN